MAPSPAKSVDLGSLAPLAQFGEQPDYLQVKPDQRHHQAEGRVPLHILGCAAARALLDEIEIQDQIQRCDHDYEQTEENANRSASEDERDLHVEQASHHADQVNESDTTSGIRGAYGDRQPWFGI